MLNVKINEKIVFEKKCHVCGVSLEDRRCSGYCSDACFEQDAIEQVKKHGMFMPYIPLQVSKISL